MKHSLDEFRKSIDRIDSAILFLLAERFNITEKVGILKKENDLEGLDPERREEQHKTLKKVAEMAGLEMDIAQKFSELIHQEVLRRHREIKST
jgi:chorismate mutase